MVCSDLFVVAVLDHEPTGASGDHAVWHELVWRIEQLDVPFAAHAGRR